MSEHFNPPGIDFYTNSKQMKLVTNGPYVGWLCYRHPDGQWVTLRKATHDDLSAIAKVSTVHASLINEYATNRSEQPCKWCGRVWDLHYDFGSMWCEETREGHKYEAAAPLSAPTCKCTCHVRARYDCCKKNHHCFYCHNYHGFTLRDGCGLKVSSEGESAHTPEPDAIYHSSCRGDPCTCGANAGVPTCKCGHSHDSHCYSDGQLKPWCDENCPCKAYEKAEVASSPSPTRIWIADPPKYVETVLTLREKSLIDAVVYLRDFVHAYAKGEWVKVTPEEELLHIAICQACGILNSLVLDAETNKAHTILRKALEDYAKKKEAANG